LIIHIKNILLAVLVITWSLLADHCRANADAASSAIAVSKNVGFDFSCSCLLRLHALAPSPLVDCYFMPMLIISHSLLILCCCRWLIVAFYFPYC